MPCISIHLRARRQASIQRRRYGVRRRSGLAQGLIWPLTIALTCFVLAGNTLLRPLVNAINRAPIDQGATEAIYEVRLTTSAEHLDENRELLRERLESANYPPQHIEVIEREQGEAELVATLMGTTADPRELDEIASRLEKHPGVENASWSLRTTE